MKRMFQSCKLIMNKVFIYILASSSNASSILFNPSLSHTSGYANVIRDHPASA